MSLAAKVWFADEPKPAGLSKFDGKEGTPPNWFRELPEYAAKLYCLECCRLGTSANRDVFVIDNHGKEHRFTMLIRTELHAYVKRTP